MKALAAARERQHLGRELHDSVTQTVFSLYPGRAVGPACWSIVQPSRLPAHLSHLTALAQLALTQMHTLVSGSAAGQPGSRGTARGPAPPSGGRLLTGRPYGNAGPGRRRRSCANAGGRTGPVRHRPRSVEQRRQALRCNPVAGSSACRRFARTRSSRQRTGVRPGTGSAGRRPARDVRARGRDRLVPDARLGARRRNNAAREEDSAG